MDNEKVDYFWWNNGGKWCKDPVLGQFSHGPAVHPVHIKPLFQTRDEINDDELESREGKEK